MPSLYPTLKSPPPNVATMSNAIPSPPPQTTSGMVTSSSSNSNNNSNHNLQKFSSTPHLVGVRQGTRSRTRTRQAQSVNLDIAGPSQPRRASLPRHQSEDHPLSSHKLAAKGYHSFQCLGVPFHVKRRYTFMRELGIGAYGCVALAKDNLLDCNVAIKKVTRVFERDVLARRALREVAVLRHIGLCDNVTALLDFDTSFIEFNEIYLILEASEADLSQIIRSGQSLSDAHLQYFVAQILRGVRYMHAANIIHRDLKPGNLLVNADCQLKVCDFGLARAFAPRLESSEDSVTEDKVIPASPLLKRSFPESPQEPTPTSPKAHLIQEPSVRLHTTMLDFPGGPLTEYVATRWYRAPEIMLCFRKGYGQQIDMWSVGCIVAELLGGKPIFAGKDYVDQIARINNVLGSPNSKTVDKVGSERAKTYLESLPKMPAVPFSRLYPSASPLALDLLEKLLCWDPDDRISAEEALQHPWLKAYHRSNNNWSTPLAFSRFEEVELLETIGDFRMGLERESDEMQAELDALEAEEEEAAAVHDQCRTESSDGSDRDHPDRIAMLQEKRGLDATNASSHNARGSTMKSLRPFTSPGGSPVPTPSSLATSANETSPTYETDLTSASAPHSITSGNSARKSKVRAMDGLGLLQQDQEDQISTEIIRSHNASQERRALDETLANHGLLCGDDKSQVEYLFGNRSRYRRRALTNAPSRLAILKRHGSEGNFRCPPITRVKDDLATLGKRRLIDITRRSELQREEHNKITDRTNSIASWLSLASLGWATNSKSTTVSIQDLNNQSNTISRDGSDTTTIGFQVVDTAHHSPSVQ